MTNPRKQAISLDPTQPPPYVQPGVNPQAIGYAAGLAARRGGGLPKYTDPVAGGPGPAIPALEQPHQMGMTMAQQAAQSRGADAQRNVQQAMYAHTAGPGIVVPETSASPAVISAPRDLPLLPGDTLPDESLKDPQFHHGTGSRMAQMQPHMAMKYGVIRNGQHLLPQDLAAGRQGNAPDFRGQRQQRSPAEIARDFNAAMTAPPAGTIAPRAHEEEGPTPPVGLPRTPQEAEAQAANGPGGAAQRAGQAPIPPIFDASSEDAEERAKKMIEQMDDFDYERLRREMLSDALKNPKQKETVEARLHPLDIGELIMKNSVRQRVPILPGKFEPTFESMPGLVELKLKQLLVKEAKSIAVTDAYLLDKYAVMTTTAGTVAINGNPTPSMFDANGDFSDDLFWMKFDWMLKRNIHMLASLGIHYSWFEQRVRKLFVADEGKGG